MKIYFKIKNSFDEYYINDGVRTFKDTGKFLQEVGTLMLYGWKLGKDFTVDKKITRKSRENKVNEI